MVSSVEGYRPIWTRDGNRIVYMAGSAGLYQLEVRTSPEFSAGEPIQTFDLDGNRGGQAMDAAHDGEHILVAHNEIEKRIAGGGRR